MLNTRGWTYCHCFIFQTQIFMILGRKRPAKSKINYKKHCFSNFLHSSKPKSFKEIKYHVEVGGHKVSAQKWH